MWLLVWSLVLAQGEPCWLRIETLAAVSTTAVGDFFDDGWEEPTLEDMSMFPGWATDAFSFPNTNDIQVLFFDCFHRPLINSWLYTIPYTQ
jgi:hypothetical protein